MVLTDLPFDKSKLLHSRYNLIRRPESAPNPFISKEEERNDAEETKEYAAFLKAQERKVGPSGFLDSNRYSYTYSLKKDKHKTTPRSKSRYGTTPENVVIFSSYMQDNEKDYQKKMRVIEDHMWQHKQEERELKRIEGDIIKNQRLVRHTLRDYENAVNKKKFSEEKKLNHSLERFTLMSREHLHKKEENDKQEFLDSHNETLAYNSQARKLELQLSDLERLYIAKRAAIELKRSEVLRLSQDFEAKLRYKEQEQHRLKQELADLAITLNLEAQKARVHKFEFKKEKEKEKTDHIQEDLSAQNTLEKNLMNSNNDIKASMMSKNQLDMDLAVTKSHLEIKKRDEQRHLTDTQIQLNNNSNAQIKLNNSAVCAGLDLKAKNIEHKVDAHNKRRLFKLRNYVQEKTEKESAENVVLEQKFKERQLEAQRYKHEDALKFFSKMVNKGEEKEQSLFSTVRTAEYNRKQQEHSVHRLQNSLAELKRINANKIKEELVERKRNEESSQYRLLKEKSELDKVHALREESYWKLLDHRVRLKEDKLLLQDYEKEHQRLLKIGLKSDVLIISASPTEASKH
ncbi:meiosis-specific nuclear structural protein 1-like isoform X2 [Biomphalaria pfeifferi]|uniref:Meiosis-specific nuclear structural protein 1-like isoform X2 n=1 Tax=Biomphalaria pfeifferi TaxID=112525 RepID=A0AAD8B5U6_BIOPF|nr:meiosis-specific nuclear structural protein 1-like isoform X2 [Biomphalaria pfeifferi]